MGIMTKWMSGALGNGAGQDMSGDRALKAVSDQIDPTSSLDWTCSSPTVLRKPATASTQQADKAEKEAALFEVGVKNGKRVLKAEGRKQAANADLVGAHRQYLGKTAAAHLLANKANTRLANQLQGMREDYAALGMGVEHQQSRVADRIDVVAAKYGKVAR